MTKKNAPAVSIGKPEPAQPVGDATIKLRYGNKHGRVTQRHITFYRRRAQGNIRLMTTEPMYVTLNDRELPTQLGIHNDDDHRSEGTDKRRSRRGRTDDGSYQPRWAGSQPQAGAGDMDILAKNMLLKRLEKNGVKLMPGTKVQRLTKDTISAEQGEAEITLPIETVVVVVGVRPNRKLPEALADSGLEIHTIGDAISPRKALEAIWEGFEAGNQI